MAPRSVALVVAAFVLSATAAAQPRDGRLSLGGTVINTSTGEPVKRALVQVIRFGASIPASPGKPFVPPPPPFTASAFTGTEGSFQFDTLAAGDYSISAQKPGFIQQQDAADGDLMLKLASSVQDIKLRLTPLGVLTGRVVDQAGQPVHAADIVLLKVSVVDGWRRTGTAGSISTDDRGMYRLWNVQPGKYFMKAAGRGGGMYLYEGDASPQSLAPESFVLTYFGGGRTLDSAVPIEIEPGAEARADLALKLEPAYTIRGLLTNFVARSVARFELLSGDEDVSAKRVIEDPDTGRFEIQDVVPGSYILRAAVEQSSAEVAVNVGNSDVNGVSLSLAPGIDVRGSTLITNAPPDAPIAGGPLRRKDSVSCWVTLTPAGARGGETFSSDSGEGGEFTVRGVMPGAYRISLECHGGYARSAMSGAQNLLADPILTIQPGAAPHPIEVVATDGGGTIRGQVSVHSSLTPNNMWVLLVPQFVGSTGPVLEIASWLPSQAGGLQFEVRDLMPGSYVAYAFSNRDDIEFRNPQFLRSLSGGVHVQAEDASEKTISITEMVR